MNAVIISAAYWYDAQQLRPFLRSAKKNIPFARVVLLRDRHDPEFASTIQSFNPRAEVYVPADSPARRVFWRATRKSPKLSPLISGIQNALRLSPQSWPFRHLHTMFLPIASSRYAYALSIVRNASQDRVLLCDSRDVVFQANPFEDLDDRLHCGEESILIGNCPINSKWMHSVYSEAVFNEIARHPVLCSGVTLGSKKTVTAYLNSMVSEMLNIAGRLYFAPGYDQAVHNKLLRLDCANTLKSSKNGGPLIATLHYSSLDEFGFDDSSGLSTKNGGSVKIVHQYDRNAMLKHWFETKYA